MARGYAASALAGMSYTRPRSTRSGMDANGTGLLSTLVIPPRLCTDLCEGGVGAEGLDAPGFGRKGVPGSTIRVDDGLVVGQEVVRERAFAQVQPDALHRVELRAVGRQRHEGDVGRDGDGTLVVPACAIEHRDGVRVGRHGRGEVEEEAAHGLGADPRQDKREVLAGGGPHGCEMEAEAKRLSQSPGGGWAPLPP